MGPGHQLEVVIQSEHGTVEDQASIVADLVDLQTVGEIAWNLPNRSCDTRHRDNAIADVRGPATADTDSRSEGSLAEESKFVGRVVVGIIAAVELRRRRHHGGSLRVGACEGRGADVIVVDPERGATVKVHSLARAPCCEGTKLETDQIIGDVIAVIKVISASKHGVVFAGGILQIVAESEPANAAEHAEPEPAALRSIPRCTWASRTG